MRDEVIIGFLTQIKEILLHDDSYLESTKNPMSESFDRAIKSIDDNTKLKEAIGKIKEEIELVTKFGNSFQPIEHGLLFSIIDKHTEGLV